MHSALAYVNMYFSFEKATQAPDGTIAASF